VPRPLTDLLSGLRKVVNNPVKKVQQEITGSSVSSEAIAYVEFAPIEAEDAGRFLSGQDTLLSALTGGTLTIQFVERGTYEYYDVPTTVWIALKSAGSKGKYFNDNIRGLYEYQRVG